MPDTSGGRSNPGGAKEKDLHFHDLRGTAVTRLALSNCSVPEIASITGHSLKTVQEILDAHYLGGRVELAESAIKKLSEVYA
jgi:integrase